MDNQGQEVEKVIEQLESNGHGGIKLLSDGSIACVCPSGDSWVILTGVDNRGNYEKGWLYYSYDIAVAELKAWVGIGRPSGWYHSLVGYSRW